MKSLQLDASCLSSHSNSRGCQQLAAASSSGRRDLKTTVLYGFPLVDPGDMMLALSERRFLACSECACPLENALTCSACQAAICESPSANQLFLCWLD